MSVKSNELISIIVPVYNVEHYIDKCIISIVEQSYKYIEIILVDDGSTDRSLDKCKQWQEKDKRIHVYHQKNSGTGVARNTGLGYAHGKYVYFCDPDDYLDQNLIKDNYNFAESNNAEVVIFGFYEDNYNTQRSKLVTFKKKIYKNKLEFIDDFTTLYQRNLISSLWNKLYLRSSLMDLKFSTARTGQDNRFNIMYFEHVERVVFNSKCYYHYLISRPNSAQTKIKLDKAILRIEEIHMLQNLIFNSWHLHTKKYKQFIDREYVQIGWLAIQATRSFAFNERKKKIEVVIKKANIYMHITDYKPLGLKEKYKVTIVKRYKNFVILELDKLIARIYGKYKSR